MSTPMIPCRSGLAQKLRAAAVALGWVDATRESATDTLRFAAPDKSKTYFVFLTPTGRVSFAYMYAGNPYDFGNLKIRIDRRSVNRKGRLIASLAIESLDWE